MDREYASQAERGERPTPFLETVNDRLGNIKQIAYGINESLRSAGFYPKPVLASGTASEKVPTDPNLRGSLEDQLERILDALLEIRDQVDRLV